MNAANFLKFIFSPKQYIKKLVREHKNNFVLNLLDQENLVPIDNTSDNDVFIVGFPKSGNTWMQSLISGLYYGIDSELLPDSLAQELVPDVHYKKYYKRFGNICFFKSHSLPQQHYKKVIYIVRDGRDAMCSYLHFNTRLGNSVTLEEMINTGKFVFPCDWHNHVQQWLSNPYNSKIHYIRYEDLLNNTFFELKKIASFIGIDRTDEQINKAIEGNTLENMRTKAIKYNGLGQKDWRGDIGINFFRKGVVGDFKNEMTDDLIQKFNQKSEKELKAFNYTID